MSKGLIHSEQDYRALKRHLKNHTGFNFSFVRCSSVQLDRFSNKIKQDLSNKQIESFTLTPTTTNIESLIDKLKHPKNSEIEILLIRGVEDALFNYINSGVIDPQEESQPNSVLPILDSLNQPLEKLSAQIQICLVFLVPRFCVQYFNRRTSDSFHWGSGLFEIPTDLDLVKQESDRVIAASSYQEYLDLSPQERWLKILTLQDLIEEENQSAKRKPDLYLEQGNVYVATSAYEQAIASYDQALHYQPEKDQAWYNRGIALYELGQYEEAVTSYDHALHFKPNKEQAWYNRGIALYELERYDEAIMAYNQAIRFKPSLEQAWNNKGYTLYELGRYEEAVEAYEQAVKLRPDLDQAWNNRGNALFNLGRYEEAITCYDKALHFHPEKDEAWNNRGVALGNLGDYLQAINSYDQALKYKPDKDESWYNRGIALDELGRYEEAVDSYEQALRHRPDNDEAWYNQGIALDELGRYEEAVGSYDQALHFKPYNYQAWYNRGNALSNLGRYQEAIASYEPVLHFQPENDEAWYNKACCYAKLGEIELAVQHLQQAINLNPGENMEMAKNDPDLASIREDERLKSLIGGDSNLKMEPEIDFGNLEWDEIQALN